MKIIESKLYSQLIGITDYLILGIIWVIASLPLITLVPASVAVFHVIAQWEEQGTGRVLFNFYQGLKKQLPLNLLLSLVTIYLTFSVDLLLGFGNQVLQIACFFVSFVYFMFLISWIDHCSSSVKTKGIKLFEKSSFDLFAQFKRNLICCCIGILFFLLVFVFPPFIFIFAGAVWKLLFITKNRKRKVLR